jgi:hypothetical protein
MKIYCTVTDCKLYLEGNSCNREATPITITFGNTEVIFNKVTAICGKNGSGKTHMLKLINDALVNCIGRWTEIQTIRLYDSMIKELTMPHCPTFPSLLYIDNFGDGIDWKAQKRKQLNYMKLPKDCPIPILL